MASNQSIPPKNNRQNSPVQTYKTVTDYKDLPQVNRPKDGRITWSANSFSTVDNSMEGTYPRIDQLKSFDVLIKCTLTDVDLKEMDREEFIAKFANAATEAAISIHKRITGK